MLFFPRSVGLCRRTDSWGWVLDKLGNRLTYFFSVLTWSPFTLLQGLAQGVPSLLGMRLGLGLAEAPCFPTNSRVVADWFPEGERARATAVYTVGEYLGLAAFGPILFWISNRYSWRAMFFAVGAVGIVFGLIWRWLYRDRSPHANRAPVSWKGAERLLRLRPIWGASLGQFGGN